MSSSNLPGVPMGLPLCPSLNAVVAAADRDAFESGYVACRRHLISAALYATDVEMYLPEVDKDRLAHLRQRAALATNMMLDPTLFPRRPNCDLGRSDGFNAALRDAAKLAADLGAACVCPSHLLVALMCPPAKDLDGIDPSYWHWCEVAVKHPTN